MMMLESVSQKKIGNLKTIIRAIGFSGRKFINAHRGDYAKSATNRAIVGVDIIFFDCAVLDCKVFKLYQLDVKFLRKSTLTRLSGSCSSSSRAGARV